MLFQRHKGRSWKKQLRKGGAAHPGLALGEGAGGSATSCRSRAAAPVPCSPPLPPGPGAAPRPPGGQGWSQAPGRWRRAQAPAPRGAGPEIAPLRSVVTSSRQRGSAERRPSENHQTRSISHRTSSRSRWQEGTAPAVAPSGPRGAPAPGQQPPAGAGSRTHSPQECCTHPKPTPSLLTRVQTTRGAPGGLQEHPPWDPPAIATPSPGSQGQKLLAQALAPNVPVLK